MEIPMDVIKRVVEICEVIRIRGESPDPSLIGREVLSTELDKILKYMVDERFLDESLLPTEKGRKLIRVGLTGGTFDIIHIGHMKTLEEAKKYVDLLAVVVARDSTVKKMKNRDPLNNEEIRLEIVSMLKPVDVAILGSEEDFMEPVKLIKPDIIFLGYDQDIPPPLKNKLGDIEIKKLDVFYKGYKSSIMIKKLLSMLGY